MWQAAAKKGLYGPRERGGKHSGNQVGEEQKWGNGSQELTCNAKSRYRMERNVADILNFPSRCEKLNSKRRCRRSRFLRGIILHQILNYTIASKVIFKEQCLIERAPKARIRINSFCQQQEVLFSIL